MTNHILRVDELVAGYIPGVNILNGDNIEVAAGEFVGIIGPNGAGKSTVLKAILGECTVRSGHVSFLDGDITGRKAYELVERGIGYVPQTKNVFPSLTVTENLEMGCFLRPKLFSERYEYVTAIFPRLAERASSRAGSLSGGERQMVAMGRALMLDPKLLLLDEPSAGLSPVLQDEVFVQCREINKRGISILMVLIWFLTGRGYFWPMWVMAGFVVGLSFMGIGVFTNKPLTEDEIQREMQKGS